MQIGIESTLDLDETKTAVHDNICAIIHIGWLEPRRSFSFLELGATCHATSGNADVHKRLMPGASITQSQSPLRLQR